MSLRLRILTLFLGVAAAAAAYLALVWAPAVERAMTEQVRVVTDRHLDTVIEGIVPYLLQGQYASVHETLDALKARNPDWTRLDLYSWNGLRIYPLAAGQDGQLGRTGLTLFERNIVIEGTQLARLTLAADLAPLIEARRAEAFELAWVLFGAFMTVLLGAAVTLDVWVRRPVGDLALAAERLAEEDYDTPLPRPREDEIGELVRAFASMRDSVRESARALQDSESRFRDFGASAADWYWEMDADLRFSYFSDRFTQVTGVKPEVLLGKTREETGIPGLAEEAWQEHLDNLRNHRSFRNFVHPRTRPDGKVVWLSINGRPVFDPDGTFKGYRGTGADITALKSVELELQAARDEAERERKLAEEANQAKSLFLSSMSHELRTPLNAVMGFGQLLKLGKLEPGQVEPVEQILKSGNHLLDLINQVLDLSRIDAGNLSMSIEDVYARDVMTPCVEMARTIAEKKGVVINDRTRSMDMPLVRADKTRLTQALLNLLSNAAKYSHDKGQVYMDAEIVDGMLRITVSDEGKGIPFSLQDKLFEPFNRLGAESSTIEGTGIGLTITKELMELMKGAIGFSSTPGKGSRFWIDIPVAFGAAQSLERFPAQAKALPRDLTHPRGETGHAHVMYVEDNRANAELMKLIFEELPNLDLECATSAEIALELMQARRPDLVLMDIDLPGMSGLEAFELMRSIDGLGTVPVLAVSADAMSGSIDKALRLGFKDYITKPFEVIKVVRAVADALKD